MGWFDAPAGQANLLAGMSNIAMNKVAEPNIGSAITSGLNEAVNVISKRNDAMITEDANKKVKELLSKPVDPANPFGNIRELMSVSVDADDKHKDMTRGVIQALGMEQQDVNAKSGLANQKEGIANQRVGIDNQFKLGTESNKNQLLGIQNQYKLGSEANAISKSKMVQDKQIADDNNALIKPYYEANAKATLKNADSTARTVDIAAYKSMNPTTSTTATADADMQATYENIKSTFNKNFPDAQTYVNMANENSGIIGQVLGYKSGSMNLDKTHREAFDLAKNIMNIKSDDKDLQYAQHAINSLGSNPNTDKLLNIVTNPEVQKVLSRYSQLTR